MILEAPAHDNNCVLANILAAHFLCSYDPSKAPSHLQAAKSRLVSLFQFSPFVSFNEVFTVNETLIVDRNKLPRTRRQFSMLSIV